MVLFNNIPYKHVRLRSKVNLTKCFSEKYRHKRLTTRLYGITVVGYIATVWCKFLTEGNFDESKLHHQNFPCQYFATEQSLSASTYGSHESVLNNESE